MPLNSSTAFFINFNGVTARVWDEGLKMNWGRLKTTATRVLRCDWVNLPLVCQWLRGGWFNGTYTPPQLLPKFGYSSLMPDLYADEIEVRGQAGTYDPTGPQPGVGSSTGPQPGIVNQPQGLLNFVGANTATATPNNGGAATLVPPFLPIVGYKYAILTVCYTTLDWLAQQQLGSLAIDFAQQWMELPDGTSGGTLACKFASDSSDVDQPPPLPMTVIDFTISRFHLLQQPVSTILTACAAPCNSVAMPSGFNASQLPTSLTSTLTPGTVLFTGCHSERVIDSHGNENFNLTMKLKYRAIPWDQIVNPNITSGLPYDQVQFKSNGQPIIKRGDLNQLFIGTT